MIYLSQTEWNPLLELRGALGLTQEEVAGVLKIGRSSVSKIEKGRNKLTDRNIELLCRHYGVRREWLEAGEGDMKDRMLGDAFDQLRAAYDLRPSDLRLIESLLRLNEAERDVLINWMESFVSMQRREAPPAKAAEKSLEEQKAEVAEEYGRQLEAEEGPPGRSGACGPGFIGTA